MTCVFTTRESLFKDHGQEGETPHCKSSAILDVIRDYVPTAQVVEEIGTEITYVLPVNQDQTVEFGAMFEAIDNHRDELMIDKYGVSDSTLEEVSDLTKYTAFTIREFLNYHFYLKNDIFYRCS